MYYTTLKIYHREYIRPAPKFYALLCAICWVPALYFFTSVQKSTDITPAESRNLNEGLFTSKMFFKTEFLLKTKQLLSIVFSLRNVFASKFGGDTALTTVFTDSFYFHIFSAPRRIKLFPHFVFEIFLKWYPIKTSADPQYSIELWLRITDSYRRYQFYVK